MPDSLWVARLIISSATATKLSALHQLDHDEIRHAIECVPGLRPTWDHDPVRGMRVFVEVEIRGQSVAVVLYPVQHPLGDVYALGSAYGRK